jgi:3-hydroxyisobutyrate dehydrogenase
VPMPVSAVTQEIVRSLLGHGYDDVDFAALLELEARAAGHDLQPEDVPVSDGLSDDVPTAVANA